VFVRSSSCCSSTCSSSPVYHDHPAVALGRADTALFLLFCGLITLLARLVAMELHYRRHGGRP
jgi:hypothetical protein